MEDMHVCLFRRRYASRACRSAVPGRCACPRTFYRGESVRQASRQLSRKQWRTQSFGAAAIRRSIEPTFRRVSHEIDASARYVLAGHHPAESVPGATTHGWEQSSNAKKVASKGEGSCIRHRRSRTKVGRKRCKERQNNR